VINLSGSELSLISGVKITSTPVAHVVPTSTL